MVTWWVVALSVAVAVAVAVVVAGTHALDVQTVGLRWWVRVVEA